MSGSRDARADDASAADPRVAELYGAIPAAVEEALIATVRELARGVPAPRHDPFYGLDRRDGPSLRLLEHLTRHGDFRKYVFVLDAGAGLGGPARWLALRYGCRVVALDACQALVEVGKRLSRRARLAERVCAVAGSFEAVPTRDGVFTQIWSVEALHHARDRRRAIAELFRVLRPGSPLALQEIVRRAESVPVIGGAWRHGTESEYLDALAAAGFAGIECEDATAERAEGSPIVLSARASLDRLLAARLPEDAPWRRAAAAAREVAAIVSGPEYRVVHFFARRPSV
jgi:SAM-dependent methyltransferase